MAAGRSKQTFNSVWTLGDVMNVPNAKTATANTDRGHRERPGRSGVHRAQLMPAGRRTRQIVPAAFGYVRVLNPAFAGWMIGVTARARWLLNKKDAADPSVALAQTQGADGQRREDHRRSELTRQQSRNRPSATGGDERVVRLMP